jgi:hypothetical protein
MSHSVEGDKKGYGNISLLTFSVISRGFVVMPVDKTNFLGFFLTFDLSEKFKARHFIEN